MQYKITNDYPQFPTEYYVLYRKKWYNKWKYVKSEDGWIIMFDYHSAKKYVEKHQPIKKHKAKMRDDEKLIIMLMILVAIYLFFALKQIYKNGL